MLDNIARLCEQRLDVIEDQLRVVDGSGAEPLTSYCGGEEAWACVRRRSARAVEVDTECAGFGEACVGGSPR